MWKQIVGYEGYYEVSDAGLIRRVTGGQGAVAGRLLSTKRRSAKGYGVKANCAANNLEWTTPKGNAEHAVASGLHRPCRGEANGRAKLQEVDVQQIRGLAGLMSQRDIAVRFGIARSLVQRIIQRKAWASVAEWPEDLRVRQFPEVRT